MVRGRIEVVRALVEIEQLRRPQRSVFHVDVGLAHCGLLECFTEFVELDRQQNQRWRTIVGMMLELRNEFGIAGPTPRAPADLPGLRTTASSVSPPVTFFGCFDHPVARPAPNI